MSTKNIVPRAISLCTALVFIAFSVVGCAGKDPDADETTPASAAPVVTVQSVTDKYAGSDLGQKTIRIYSSTNRVDYGNGMSSSNKYIEGDGDASGDEVLDLVYRRNYRVEQLLNCTVEYTHTNLDYPKVLANFEGIAAANTDLCDIYINDQWGLARASLNGYVCNVLAIENSRFDFESKGWYGDYMRNLTVGNERMYLLAGDYTLDILRNANVLYFNKTIYTSLFGNADGLYRTVSDMKWTYDELASLVEAAYLDTNGLGDFDQNDRYGIIMPGQEGSLFPFVFSGDVRTVTHDADNLLVINSDLGRAESLCSAILGLFTMRGASYAFKTDNLMSKFTSGGALFTNYFRIGDFEDSSLREMKNTGLLPYPMLDLNQEKYYTYVHDTAELAVIPKNCSDPAAASLFLQVMTEYTNEEIIPIYYGQALKIKYANDEPTANMIDIVRNNITSTFESTYGYKFKRPLYVSVRDSVTGKTNVLSSTYASEAENIRIGVAELNTAFGIS